MNSRIKLWKTESGERLERVVAAVNPSATLSAHLMDDRCVAVVLIRIE
jgi:hypothetical protein